MLSLVMHVAVNMLAAFTGCQYVAGSVPAHSPVEVRCITPGHHAYPDAPLNVGFYNGYTDTIYIHTGLSPEYTAQVVAHEVAHDFDLDYGTWLNGRPSFFSETRTGFDVEAYAVMVTWVEGDWPPGESYWGPRPTPTEIEAMYAAGWLPPRPASELENENV